MTAIKPCVVQIYLFLYTKSHLIRIHTAINYLLTIGLVQARGCRCPWKKFERSVTHVGDFNKNASKVWHWGSNFKIALSLSFLSHPNHTPRELKWLDNCEWTAKYGTCDVVHWRFSHLLSNKNTGWQVWGISETRDRKLSLKCAIADCPCKGKSI